MAVVLLSSDPFCRSDELASRVARDLGYDLLGPEIEAAAAETFDVSLEKLRQDLSSSPSLSPRLPRSRRRHLAYFQASFLSALSRGDVVYRGEFGHMLVSDVSHVVKVKVTADLEDRAAWRTEAQELPQKRARELLLKEEAQRRKWFLEMFGVEGTDPSAFDLVVDLTQMGVDDACKTIVETVREVRFQPLTYSIKTLRDQHLACRVRATLIKDYPDVAVTARDGEVRIRSKPLAKDRRNRASSVRSLVLDMEGVTYVLFE